jgi:hypothetical protein
MTTQTLPALTGSEKQIEWATETRRGIIGRLEAGIEVLEERLAEAPEEKRERLLDRIARRRAALSIIRQWTEAKRWINIRTYNREAGDIELTQLLHQDPAWIPLDR